MMSEVTNLSGERESRAMQSWRLAGIDPPTTITAAAHIADHCLSRAKVKAGLVQKHASWELKRTASLNLVAQMLEFQSWRHLQQYAKNFHTLGVEEWRTDTLSVRMVSACWTLTAKQETEPVARSLLRRKLTVDVTGVSAAHLKELLRVAMCAPATDSAYGLASGAEEEFDDDDDEDSGLYIYKSHYRERFVEKIPKLGIDVSRLKANATELLAKTAPTLPVEVSRDLVDYCLGGPMTKLLINHHRWQWPQADPNDRALWGYEHRQAAERAADLQYMLDGKFGGWLVRSDMRDLRRWQNTYLSGPKSRSKYQIYDRLIAKINEDKAVPPDLATEYKDWAKAVQSELDREVHASKQPPVPRHFEYLVDMVFVRLDALIDYLDTTERDRVKQAVADILAAAATNPLMPSVKTILAELLPRAQYWYAVIKTVSTIEPALEVIVDDAKKLVLSQAKLKKFCLLWKMDTPVINRCRICSRNYGDVLTEKKLPPYRPHCSCGVGAWQSSALHLEEEKDWPLYRSEGRDLGYTRHHTKLMWWMLHRLLGLNCDGDFPVHAAFYTAPYLEKRRASIQPSVH